MAVTRFDLGPSPSAFYLRNVNSSQETALQQLLAELLATEGRNARPLGLKTARLVAALVALLVTVAYSALALTLA